MEPRPRSSLLSLLAFSLLLGCSPGESPPGPPATERPKSSPAALPTTGHPEPSPAATLATSSPALATSSPTLVALSPVGAGLLPVFSSPSPRGLLATVFLGADASRPFVVAEPVGGVSVAVRLLGAAPSVPHQERGEVLYPDALGPGVIVVQRPHPRGTEDLVRFPARPTEEVLRYELNVREVKALRLVPGTDTLELLDGQGAPRLRVRPPSGVDAQGRVFPATLAVEGCAVDKDARAPWGRSMMTPGAESCGLVVRWSAPSYPAEIDPAWETTGDLSVPRSGHTATKLKDGRVLVTGGYNTSGTLTSAELYDPATGTWALTAPLNVNRYEHRATLLEDGRVLIAGGASLEGTLELYDPSSGSFSLPGSFLSPRSSHAQALLPGGDVLIAGGTPFQDVAYRVQVADGFAIKPLLSSGIEREEAFAVELPDGRVLVAGGEAGELMADLFDPVTESWTSAFVPGGAHRRGAGVLLDDGRAALVGGVTPFELSGVVALFDAASDTWSQGPSLQIPRYDHTATALPGGRVLVAGGSVLDVTLSPLASAELVDVGAQTSILAGQIFPRSQHRAVLLDDGSLLLVGGLGQKNAPLSSVLRCPDGVCEQPCALDGDCPPGLSCAQGVCQGPSPNGTGCQADSNCQSGHCADGVCCNSACEGACISCEASEKFNGASGLCGPVLVGTDPKNGCKSDGLLCGADGFCNGLGLCRTAAPVGALCSSTPTCNQGSLVAKRCNGNGSCEASSFVLKSCFPYGCDGEVCATACSEANPCVGGFLCVAGLCKAPAGSFCNSGTECASGFCADFICCDTACDGPCERCSGGVTPVGQCAPVPAGQPGKCGFGPCDPVCDGTSAQCGAPPPDGTNCGVPWCSGSNIQTPVCKSGACSFEKTPCFPHDCALNSISGDGQCRTSCSWTTDCAQGATCRNGTCVETVSGGLAGGGGEAAVEAEAEAEGPLTPGGGCDCGAAPSRGEARWGWAAGLLALAARGRRRKSPVGTARRFLGGSLAHAKS